MKCSCAQCRFSAYLDHDLDHDEELELRDHLQSCAECSSELAAVKETLSVLADLPETDPGADFYAGVTQMIHASGESFGGEEEARPRTFLGRLQLDWLTTGLLRPALGMAVGLVAGIILMTSSPPLVAFLGGGSKDGNGSPSPGEHRAIPETMANRETGDATSGNPLAGIELPPLDSLSDVMGPDGEPEYVLEPYVPDPNGGLIPADRAYGRTVGSDWDSQSDVFVTF